MTAIEVSPEEMKKLEEKKAKKEKKKAKKDKRKHDEEDDEGKDDDNDDNDDTKNDRSQKRDEKKKLMELVPERDADGIAYTKMQRRRMMKRVKRGLDPVPTPHEEAERIKNDAQLKRDEEAELSGMMFVREEEDDDDDDDDDEEMEDKEDDDDDSPAAPAAAKSPFDDPNAFKPNVFNKKRKLSNKPVPADYVCSACQNKNDPLHWIYDCPDKITKRGTNQVSKKQKGVHDPDSKKVFVSGLSFEAKRKDVEALFASCGGKIVQCKLLTFEDTGRCKGQAYLTFDSESSAKKALALSGTTFENTVADGKKKKGEPKEIKRKELKLKVTKMLNRSATKQGSRY